MKKISLAKKLIILIAVPFALSFVIIYSLIFYTIREDQIRSYNIKMNDIAKMSIALMKAKIDSVLSSVCIVADNIEMLKYNEITERSIYDASLKGLFQNPDVYNAWFAFSDNIIDGEDSLHKDEYPGAPSGRFMRSYLKTDAGEEIIVAPDMDESVIDDIQLCPWYAVPFTTGTQYIDYSGLNSNLYDYGVEDSSEYTLSIAVPVFYNDEVIGCVGADLKLDFSVTELTSIPGSCIAVFYENGIVFFQQDEYEKFEDLNDIFKDDTQKIKESLKKNQPLFYKNMKCPYNKTDSCIYLYPAYLTDARLIYIYISIPRSVVTKDASAIISITIALVFSVLIFFSMLYFVSYSISHPIKKLTAAARKITLGDINEVIPVFSNSKMNDEISIMSKAFYQMAEQLRINIFNKDNDEQEKEFTKITYDVLYSSKDAKDALKELSKIMSEYFMIGSVRILCKINAKLCVVSEYRDGCEEIQDIKEFLFADDIVNFVGDKDILYYNHYAITQNMMKGTSPDTKSLCVVPLKDTDEINGFIICESKRLERCLTVNDERLLLKLGKELFEFIKNKGESAFGDVFSARQLAVESTRKNTLISGAASDSSETDNAPDEPKDILKQLSLIDGLNVDKALAAVGNLQDIYLGSVTLFKNLIPAYIKNFDSYIVNDSDSFSREMHKIKSTLANVGFFDLSKMAKYMEQTSKIDMESCKTEYSNFKQLLMNSHMMLTEILDEDTAGSNTKEDIEELKQALKYAQDALERYNTPEARSLLDKFRKAEFKSAVNAVNNDDLAKLFEYLDGYMIDEAAQQIKSITEQIDN